MEKHFVVSCYEGVITCISSLAYLKCLLHPQSPTLYCHKNRLLKLPEAYQRILSGAQGLMFLADIHVLRSITLGEIHISSIHTGRCL